MNDRGLTAAKIENDRPYILADLWRFLADFDQYWPMIDPFIRFWQSEIVRSNRDFLQKKFQFSFLMLFSRILRRNSNK
jgi:hypothetical protein